MKQGPTKVKSATRVFEKNLTSRLLVEALLEIQMTPETRCLDLGCGDGNIVLEVGQMKGLQKVFGSDVSNIAIDKASSNAINIDSDFRCGDSFEPWRGQAFDIISCDVAAISETIACNSSWYEGVDCDTGEDGLRLVTPLIEQAKHYLMDDGVFVTPSISLANEGRLLSHLDKVFDHVEMVKKKEWPIPNEIIQRLKNAQLSMTCCNWNITEKFGLFVANTSIYLCSDS